ncbi:MAG TPA: hypothetical protein VG708_11545 [Mycobacteriales bacterium]|nr:hypothetical protein [Mycobacteriales bacterium]
MSEADPLLPDTTADERPVGWGDDRDEYDDDADSDEERLAVERPPHYDR